MMTIRLSGLGFALPECYLSQRDWLEGSIPFSVSDKKQQRLAPRLYDMSGIDKRYSVVLSPADTSNGITQSLYAVPSEQRPLGPSTADRMQAYNQYAAPLAETAARQALERSDISSSDITHLVTVSCSGFAAPGFDIALIRNLPLAATTSRTHVGFMGCHGALNGLRVAKALAAEPGANVLLVAVELCSLHYQYQWTPQRMVANSLFSDGAAAVVVSQRASGPALVANLGQLMPECSDAMTWHIGDTGFDMTLSPSVPELISQHLRPALTPWLAQHGLTIEQVPNWAIHPGGPRILDACAEALGLTEPDVAISREVLAAHGNMSSPTVLFVLDRILQRGTPGPIVALGFGPGLALEAALLGE